MASILVVDDDDDIRALIQTVLETEGHAVTLASEGQEGLNKIRRKQFDLVILDIMMPAMSGYEVLEQIREIPSRAETPVIVVTAKHDPSGVLREVKGGAVDHLAKPFLPEELEEAVRRALGGSPESTEERRRALRTEAEVYGSMADLFDDARSDPDKKKSH
ncbi:MAG: response regulator [Actinomycetota bacterium]